DCSNGKASFCDDFWSNSILRTVRIFAPIADIIPIVVSSPNNGIIRFGKGQIVDLLGFGGVKAKSVVLSVVDTFVACPSPVTVGVLVPAHQVSVRMVRD